MCGHVGIAGNIFKNSLNMFNNMLIADSVRGMHSTGVVSLGLSMTTPPEEVKCVGPASNLLELKKYDSVVASHKAVLMGHNRHATMGAHTKANAHPFIFSNIVGAHNGTLDYQSKQRLTKLAGEEFETDSETIFAAFNKEHPEDVLPFMAGAWALVWVNLKERTLNMLRNGQRDLCYAFSDDKKLIIWASEALLLRWCSYRNDVKLFEDKIYRVTEDRWYSWEIPSSFSKSFPDSLQSDLKGAALEETQGRFHFGNGWTARRDSGQGKAQQTQQTAKKEDEKKPASNVVALLGKAQEKADSEADDVKSEEQFASIVELNKTPYIRSNPKGGNFRVSKPVWEKKFESCCSHCGTPLPWADVIQGAVKVSFLNDRQVLCETCVDDVLGEDWLVDFYNRSHQYGI